MKVLHLLLESSKKKYKLLYFIIPFIVLVCVPFFKLNMINFILNILILVFIYLALGQTWNILAGFLGLLSMGHCVFFGLGAYMFVLVITKLGLGPLWGILFGILLNVVLAWIIGTISVRVKDIFFAMVTLAVSQTLYYLALQWLDLTRGPRGLLMPPVYMFSKQTLYYIAFAAAVLSIGIVYLIRNSKLGTLFIAIRDNEDKAKSLGVNSFRLKVLGCIISAVIASVIGSYYAVYIRAVQPTIFSFDVTMKIMILVFVGGIGNISGPILGAFTVIIADELIRGWLGGQFSGLPGIVYGLVLVVMIMYKPGGLSSIFSRDGYVIKK